ncbi:MAG: efflux RND transporter periplasmic adaptor subunit [Hyphomonadaceae bacterium]
MPVVVRKHFFLFGALAALGLVLLASVVRLAAAAALSAGGQAPGARAVAVSLATSAEHPFVDRIAVLGVAKGRMSVTITSSTAELVTAVRFSDGQKVKKDQVLVELKAREQAADVAQAVAAYNLAKADDDRWTRLAEAGIASKASQEQYHAAFQAAQANLAAARSRQGDRVVRAPFAGVVGLTDVAPGALIQPGMPIVTLDDTSLIRVDFDVPDRYLPYLKEGAPIRAQADNYPDQIETGRIAKIDSRIDVNTRSIKARAEFPNPAGRIRPGMLMRVSVDRGARDAVAAPEAAVAVDAGQSYVFVARQEGERMIAERREVKIGLRQDGLVEITDGLKAGERIVADGLNRVEAGRPIRLASAGGDKRAHAQR